MNYSAIPYYAKGKAILELLPKIQLPCLIVCNTQYEAHFSAIESSLMPNLPKSKIYVEDMTDEEQHSILDWFINTPQAILFTDIKCISSLYGNKAKINTIIHTYLPPTAELYYKQLHQLTDQDQASAIVIWNYNDTINGTDFSYDLNELGLKAEDAELAISFIRQHNRMWNITEAGYKLTEYLNKRYQKQTVISIWTYKDSIIILKQLLIEQKLHEYKWPFKGKIGIRIQSKILRLPHLQLQPLQRFLRL